MSSAEFALQKAIFEKLSNDSATLAALGGPRIYDDAPARAEFPFMIFGQSTARDWSTGTDVGYEHEVTLHIWSRGRGPHGTHAQSAPPPHPLNEQDFGVSGPRRRHLTHA